MLPDLRRQPQLIRQRPVAMRRLQVQVRMQLSLSRRLGLQQSQTHLQVRQLEQLREMPLVQQALLESIGGRRALLPGLHLLSISEAVNGLWPEYSELEKKAFLVRPQPILGPLDREVVTVVVEFYDHLYEHDASIVPVLQECFRHGEVEISRVASYCSQVFSGTQAHFDSYNCPNDQESTRIDFWVRNLPVRPGHSLIVEPGDLVSIRTVKVIETFATFSQIFPGGFEFAFHLAELSSLSEKIPATWTFVGATEPGVPAMIDSFQPQWEGLHDPHRVQHFFQSLLVNRGLPADEYILHHVPSPLLTDATFIYGRREEEGCLIHLVWSAQWNETWREQYCYNAPFHSTSSAIIARSGLRGYEWTALLDGRRVNADDPLPLYQGAQVEIELCASESSGEENASAPVTMEHDGQDESSLWQSTCQVTTGSMTQPTPLTFRPNADITLDFDEHIPLPAGGRIIPPPNWNAHPLLRVASDNDAVYPNRQGFLTVDCRTWLLPHGGRGHPQPRDIQIRAQLLLHLPERIRNLWRDTVTPRDALRIQHVRPTPLARGNQRQSPKLHLLVEVNRLLGDFSRPILLSFQQISAQGLSSEVDWLPWLSGEVITLQSILQASPLRCEPRNLLVPLADRARGWMGTQQQRHVAPGSYIPVWWDLRWNADPEPVPRPSAIDTPVDPHDDDDASLMQHNPGGAHPTCNQL